MKTQSALRLAALATSSLGLLSTQAWSQSSLPDSSLLRGTALSGGSASLPGASVQALTTNQAGAGGCALVHSQLPNLIAGIYSDSGWDNGSTSSEFTAATDLTLHDDTDVCSFTIWGVFALGNVVPPGDFDLIVHENSGGFPGAVVYSESGIAPTLTPTGDLFLGLDIYQADIVPSSPISLVAGTTYWFEIYFNSGLGTDDWAWLTGTLDAATGMAGSQVASATPGVSWFSLDQDMAIEVFGQDPNACAADDYLENNDDCGQEVVLGDGIYPDLYTSKTDWDYYMVSVAPGGTLDVSISHVVNDGDIDVFLYAAGACAPFASGDVGCAGSLDCGYSFDDDETVTYINTSGDCETLILKVNVWDGSAQDCNRYDMTITGTVGAVTGTNYCAQNANSTGGAASITALGSDVALDDQLSLVASGMPANQMGFFIVAMNAGLVDLPGANISDGFLCLGDGKGRFDGQNGNPGGLLSSGDGGTFCLAGIDTALLPASSGPSYAAVAGTSSYFTAWFRDSSGTNGNNFTDAVQIDWQ